MSHDSEKQMADLADLIVSRLKKLNKVQILKVWRKVPMLGNRLWDAINKAHNSHFQSMQGMFPSNALSIEGNNRGSDHRNHIERSSNTLAPFGMFDMGFDSMFTNMRSMMGDMHRSFESMQNNTDGHCFTQTSFQSYTNTGEGPPKIYQASSSTRSAPGGIKETRKAVRDSGIGLEKMAVGRHIHDKGHVIERSRNRRLNEDNEDQQYLNLDENELDHFNREWTEKTGPYTRGIEQGRRRERNRNVRPAIEDRRDRRRNHRE